MISSIWVQIGKNAVGDLWILLKLDVGAIKGYVTFTIWYLDQAMEYKRNLMSHMAIYLAQFGFSIGKICGSGWCGNGNVSHVEKAEAWIRNMDGVIDGYEDGLDWMTVQQEQPWFMMLFRTYTNRNSLIGVSTNVIRRRRYFRLNLWLISQLFCFSLL